jgi:hypothetical protein
MAGTAISAARATPWRLILRIVRWTTYASALITLILLLHKASPPVVERNPQAAARVEQKFEQVQRAVANGQPATLRMDQTELNSYLVSHLDIAANTARTSTPSENSNATSANPTEAATAGMPVPSGTPTEQVEQVRSAVKDVKVELIEDRVRAYMVFDFHGKDMSLQLEGKLGVEDGYLHFESVAGQIGSLPIPQSTLETALRRLMESPQNREKLKLPADMSSLKVENGEVVATYK